MRVALFFNLPWWRLLGAAGRNIDGSTIVRQTNSATQSESFVSHAERISG